MNNTDFEITFECSNEDVEFLWKGIVEYNTTVGPLLNYPKYEPYRIVVRDEHNTIKAGILTKIYLKSMYVELLWVSPEMRKERFGTKLLTMAEEYAQKNDCTFIALDTFSFQALGFYEKLNYSVFAELDDYPDGIKRYYLKKKL
jgi:ribosomal protein S18 acetylase RimI-like enzyme